MGTHGALKHAIAPGHKADATLLGEDLLWIRGAELCPFPLPLHAGLRARGDRLSSHIHTVAGSGPEDRELHPARVVLLVTL